ncbi:MAG TPA: hypothetical protein VN112_16275 [Ensifer sp.]|nr:hypothetical protein [Ensifer sp.]
MTIEDLDNVADAANDTVQSNDGAVVNDEPRAPLSIRDQLQSAMNAPKDAPEDKGGQPRDPTGRFAAKAADDAAQAAKKPDQPAAQQQAPAQQATEQQPVGAQPPASWSADAKAKFGTLPPDIQAAITKREAEVENGFKILQDYKGLEEFTPLMRQAGTTHADVMRKAISWERALQTNPIETVINVANLAKVDLRKLVAGELRNAAPQPQPTPQQQFNPAVIDQKISEHLRSLEIQKTVDAFMNDPANVHAKTVEDAMVALINTGQAKSLEDAYQMACWSNPEIRQQLISQQQATSQQQIDKQRQAQAADHARKASRSITGTASAGPSGNKPGPAATLGEELRNAFRSANGSV